MKRRIERNPLRHLFRDAGEIRREVSAEIEFPLEMRIVELERRGLSPAAAREEALRLFGDVEKTRMVCVESDVRSERKTERREYLGEIIQDLAHGLRQLRHRPVFAATAILTLALGIGATTAIFSAADHVLLRPLPYGDADRVVTLWETDRRTGASPEYFEVVGIPLRRGRSFTADDRAGAAAVALINDRLARHFFPGEDAIGKSITIGVMGRPVKRKIVGVVGDVRPTAFDSDPRPELYIPYAQSGTGSVTLVVRTRTDPAGLIPVLTSQVWQIDPDQTVYHAATLEGLISDTLVQRRFNLVILTAFSMVALVLATIGIYGLISFSTSQRTHEIGIRLALGARPAEIVRMIVAEGMRLGIPGVLLGIASALLLTRFMERMLYGVTPTDPWTFLEFGVVSILVSALAAYVPARRAAGADPAVALRQDF